MLATRFGEAVEDGEDLIEEGFCFCHCVVGEVAPSLLPQAVDEFAMAAA